eukprot:TRINITY_DN19499_c0_g1_i1.p1 TRINITY_DN19499_c0_g1~~TRINITY_DN19499_c0_g1_i1.p1  ORF type:complete len:189 (-),score=19.09 TRINITY_DN19499_c0_g1_i1:15-581(-)
MDSRRGAYVCHNAQNMVNSFVEKCFGDSQCTEQEYYWQLCQRGKVAGISSLVGAVVYVATFRRFRHSTALRAREFAFGVGVIGSSLTYFKISSPFLHEIMFYQDSTIGGWGRTQLRRLCPSSPVLSLYEQKKYRLPQVPEFISSNSWWKENVATLKPLRTDLLSIMEPIKTTNETIQVPSTKQDMAKK